MSSSSPADLAIAFRSLPRRLDDASIDAPPAAITDARSAVSTAVGAAAGLLGSEPTAQAVAAAIDGRRLADWSETDLSAIQANADAAARAIRTLANVAEAAKDN